MFEKDYIMRIIYQAIQFLARILLKIENGNIEEARIDIRIASEQFLGLQFDSILSFSSERLIDMLNIGGRLDFEKVYITAQLLFCEAKVRNVKGRADAKEIYLKSLTLLLKGFPEMDEMLQRKAVSVIDQILSTLQNQDFPMFIYNLLIPYHEQRMEYSKAEDCLLVLVENGFEKALPIGESFYERLLEKTNQELEHGNLPRSEVMEGMRELKTRYCI